MNKDNRWFNSNDPGILRKKDDKDEELLVIGYGCKLFRDDYKALELDQGKQLIPWMGNENLKIDRYDARGHLSEMSQFVCSSQDYVPTSHEREIERACDEERYRSLNQNEEEQLMYQEEEFKRLKHAASNKEYGQVQYQYSEEGPSTSLTEPEAPGTQPAEDLELFVLNPMLVDDIPPNLVLPTTKKENQIIEKTAAYMASHGSQVEIMVKTREARNEKLGFMHVGSPLNPYYNFIVEKIKSGRYKPGEQTATSHTDYEPSGGDYLHPLLAASTTIESAPSIPSIAYKSSGDSAYDMLVKNIRNVQQSQELAAEKVKPASSSKATKPSDKDLSSGSKKRRKKRSISDVPIGPSLPTDTEETLPPKNIVEVIAKLISFAQSMKLHPSEIASNVLTKSKKTMDFLRPGHKYYNFYIQEIEKSYKGNSKKPAEANGQSAAANGVAVEYDPEVPTEEGEGSADAVKYDPEVLTETEVEEESVKDKTTSQSPQLLRKKGGSGNDSRAANGVRAVSTSPGATAPSDSNVTHHHSIRPAPVSFSIKKPKEEKLEIPSALPVEESSSGEEENQEGKEKKSDDGENKKTETKLNQKPKTDIKEEQTNLNIEEREKEKQAKVVQDKKSLLEKEDTKKQDSPSKESVTSPVNGFHSTQGNVKAAEKPSPKTKEKRVNGSSSSLPSTSKDSPKRRKKDSKSYKSDKDSKRNKAAGLITASSTKGTGKRAEMKKRVTFADRERRREPKPGSSSVPPLPLEPAPEQPPPPPMAAPGPPPTTSQAPENNEIDLLEMLEIETAKKRERKRKAKELLEKMKREGNVLAGGSSNAGVGTVEPSQGPTLGVPSTPNHPAIASTSQATPSTSGDVEDRESRRNRKSQVRESLKRYIQNIVKDEFPTLDESMSPEAGAGNTSQLVLSSPLQEGYDGSTRSFSASGEMALVRSSYAPSTSQGTRDGSTDQQFFVVVHDVNKKTKRSFERQKKSRKRSKKHSHSASRERRKRRKRKSRSDTGSSSSSSSDSSDDEFSSDDNNDRPSKRRGHKRRRHGHKKHKKQSKSKKSKRSRPRKRYSSSSSSSSD